MSSKIAKILTWKAKLQSKRRARKRTREFGIEQMRQTIERPQPHFCHDWDGPDTKGNGKQKSVFGSSVMKAYSALRNLQRLPINFSEYPEAVRDLRQCIFLQNRPATIPEFERMVQQYVGVVQTRAECLKDDKVKIAKIAKFELAKKNEGVWGSRRQWAFGALVSRLLTHFNVTDNLHPVFAAMLMPYGGIAGAGNRSLITGDMHNCIVLHGVVHDAFGYVGRFHKVGPCYNYLGSNHLPSFFFSDHNPWSCQIEGMIRARIEMKRLGMLGDKGRQVHRANSMSLLRR